MFDSVLDNILTELNEHGVNNKKEMTDDFMTNLGLDAHSCIDNPYFSYLKKQEKIDTETIPHYQIGDQFHAARNFCWITPKRVKNL